MFGMSAAEVNGLRTRGYNPRDIYAADDELRKALEMIASGYFSPDARGRFMPIFDALTASDHFMLLADYSSYIACQERVDALYRDPEEWARRAILNVAGMGRFSSDRTIMEYAEHVWKVKSVSH